MPAARSFIEADLSGLSLTRENRPILKQLSWRICPGERWVLQGANGAGKSQLLKIIAGDVWPNPATRAVRVYRLNKQRFTEPYLIKEEIAYIGAERQDKYEHYDWNFRVFEIVGTGIYRSDIPREVLTATDQKVIAKYLQCFEIAALSTRRFLTLSYGQRRLVLLARALASRPKLLLLDELFEGLDQNKRQLLTVWLNTTSRSALPWVLATHRWQDIPRAATHLAVLQQGKIRQQSLAAIRSRTTPVVQAPVIPADIPPSNLKKLRRPLVLELKTANVYFLTTAVLRKISLTLRAGECCIVHGANGSGKTTLLRAVYGDHPLQAQHVVRCGMRAGDPLENFKRRTGWVAPSLQTDQPLGLTVSELVQSGYYASVGLNTRASLHEVRGAQRALEHFEVAHLATHRLRELSYGQFRRVLFARAWVRNPQLLLLDEPFAGLDAATRTALRYRVETAITDGKAVLMTTHHRDEWPDGVTHELELRAGRMVYYGRQRL
jgi:molybdate transport system ATP-binding protein